MQAPYRTKEQVQQYLEQIFGPSQNYQIGAIEHGWLCSPQPAPGLTFSQTVGMTSLVVNAETGVVHRYPSWPGPKIVEDYTRALRTGQQPTARQIYPPQTRISIRRTNETTNQIEYQITELAERKPPHDFQLMVNKQTLEYQPTGTTSAVVISWLDWRRGQDGTWPEMGTTEY
ncbi:hypothetical protein [Nocardia cyriacigeorgica]|uniref:hypothetical protein n=1 Tax=Nocardia cyriacigeorgica TaxID=135487 RepID=UPI002114E59A|nr:hypothetical protein [Nocardia cyriacigeorgica]